MKPGLYFWIQSNLFASFSAIPVFRNLSLLRIFMNLNIVDLSILDSLSMLAIKVSMIIWLTSDDLEDSIVTKAKFNRLLSIIMLLDMLFLSHATNWEFRSMFLTVLWKNEEFMTL